MCKRIFSLLLAGVLACTLSGCSALLGSASLLFLVAIGDDRTSKSTITAFVTENESQLLAAIEAKDFSSYENTGFIKEVTYDDTVVDFFCGGAGIGSGTAYTGFFYTPEDDMTAIWCAPYSEAALSPSGDGFAWSEGKGDNRYYTEHICGKFYYYEASF